jgi:uncharacterized protein YodC (DUF2158 family)
MEHSTWHYGERVQQDRYGAVMQVVIAGRTHTYCEWYIGGRKQHSVFRNEELRPVRTARESSTASSDRPS